MIIVGIGERTNREKKKREKKLSEHDLYPSSLSVLTHAKYAFIAPAHKIKQKC